MPTTRTDADTQQLVQGTVAWSFGLIDGTQRRQVDALSLEVVDLGCWGWGGVDGARWLMSHHTWCVLDVIQGLCRSVMSQYRWDAPPLLVDAILDTNVEALILPCGQDLSHMWLSLACGMWRGTRHAIL